MPYWLNSPAMDFAKRKNVTYPSRYSTPELRYRNETNLQPLMSLALFQSRTDPFYPPSSRRTFLRDISLQCEAPKNPSSQVRFTSKPSQEEFHKPSSNIRTPKDLSVTVPFASIFPRPFSEESIRLQIPKNPSAKLYIPSRPFRTHQQVQASRWIPRNPSLTQEPSELWKTRYLSFVYFEVPKNLSTDDRKTPSSHEPIGETIS